MALHKVRLRFSLYSTCICDFGNWLNRLCYPYFNLTCQLYMYWNPFHHSYIIVHLLRNVILRNGVIWNNVTVFRNIICQCCGLMGRGFERTWSYTNPCYVLQMGFFRRKEKEELEALTKVCIGDWKEII
jgi:hypothetical protein